MNLDFYEFQSKERIEARLQEAERHRLLAPINAQNAQHTRALLHRLKVWWRSVCVRSSRSDSDLEPTTLKAQAEESQ
jgi:hypothetical protein